MSDNYFETLEFDKDDAKDVETGSLSDAGVKLPFDVLFARWVNGKPIAAANADSGIKHFGGWGISDDSIGAAPFIPEKFVYEQFVNDKGETFQNYCTRNLALAIICRRFRWFKKRDSNDVTGNPQFLAYSALYNREKKVFEPFAPIILSLKGYAGMGMDDCVKEWSSVTAETRMKEAKNIPANFFFAPYGTFGTERFTKPVKSGNTITPPRLFKPEKIDIDFLRISFVGKELMDTMIEMKHLSADWIEAWKVEDRKDDSAPKQRSKPPQQAAPQSAADIPF